MGRGSHTSKLIRLVHMLCGRLHRPVSSKDLLSYFREDPELRPLLFQRPGQLLLKLSKQKKRFGSGIYPIGIISNVAFYAPDRNQCWLAAFEAHRDLHRLEEQCCLRMPEHTTRLIGTRFDAFARNALAGFVEEFESMYQRNSPSESVLEFPALLIIAKRHATDAFVLSPPEKLISRETAGEILSKEYTKRMQIGDPIGISCGRHLVHLKWPQSSFCGDASGLFWKEQVYAYCASRWPVNVAERSLGRGISLAMRYGQGPSIKEEN